MDEKQLIEAIKKLKVERSAVLLAHNYQIAQIQDLADFVGDSLELARTAKKVDKELIVFCGVDFMAETASILNPDKKVLMPESTASCPMAKMLPASVIKAAKERHPDAEVVMYVNTSAEAKCYADIICTSGNAVEVVNSMESDEILFAPDRNLANYVQKNSKKRIIPVPQNGVCMVHENIKLSDVREIKKKHPDAKLTVHPETPPEVQDIADHIGSTKGMIQYITDSPDKEFIIGTETGIIHRMKSIAPDKSFYPACERAICINMKKITLENLYLALKNEQYEVKVPNDIADKARIAIDRMLAL